MRRKTPRMSSPRPQDRSKGLEISNPQENAGNPISSCSGPHDAGTSSKEGQRTLSRDMYERILDRVLRRHLRIYAICERIFQKCLLRTHRLQAKSLRASVVKLPAVRVVDAPLQEDSIQGAIRALASIMVRINDEA